MYGVCPTMLWGCFGDAGAALQVGTGSCTIKAGCGLRGQVQGSRSDGRASLRCGVGTEKVGDGMFSVRHGVVRTFLSSHSSFPLEEYQKDTYSVIMLPLASFTRDKGSGVRGKGHRHQRFSNRYRFTVTYRVI